MDSYKSSKKLSTETSVKNYKKGAKDAVEKFKGSQNLGYDNPEIQRYGLHKTEKIVFNPHRLRVPNFEYMKALSSSLIPANLSPKKVSQL